jgi:CheY-like chemotaxis protein
VPTDILLVEDNQGDIRLMREILGEINPTARLHVVTDGVEAMEFWVTKDAVLMHLVLTSSCWT